MVANENSEILKLENQVCFSLYSASRAFTKAYQPVLEPLGLTYTQYLVMLILWEKNKINVKEIGNLLYLDSGTLTPLLKRMETQGFIIRERSKEDERVVNISLTNEGINLKQKAKNIPIQLFEASNLDLNNIKSLKILLDDILKTLKE